MRYFANQRVYHKDFMLEENIKATIISSKATNRLGEKGYEIELDSGKTEFASEGELELVEEQLERDILKLKEKVETLENFIKQNINLNSILDIPDHVLKELLVREVNENGISKDLLANINKKFRGYAD